MVLVFNIKLKLTYDYFKLFHMFTFVLNLFVFSVQVSTSFFFAANSDFVESADIYVSIFAGSFITVSFLHVLFAVD